MVRYYNELTRLEMEQVDKDETVVMIPVGALEQHGNQCPLGTDEIIAEGTARRIKEALDREIPDYPMLIFPLIPVGLSTERPETVKLETSEAGIPKKFMGNKTFTVYGPITLGWVSEEWETEDGKPIGIGGDPSGATAEKGNQIYDSFVESILSGLKEIRRWKDVTFHG